MIANSQASWLNRSYRNPKFTTSTATKYRPHDAALRSLAGKEVIYRLMTDGSMVLGYSGFITGGRTSTACRSVPVFGPGLGHAGVYRA